MVRLGNDWDEALQGEFDKEYYKALRRFLKSEYSGKTAYPDMYDIFNALKLTPYSSVKVVILGQDPYHGQGQAHGLAFSVKPGVAPPPSLVNIFKELRDDLGIEEPTGGCLLPWAERGVLLLNAALTVRAGEANSHRGMGWEIFTDRVIELLNQRAEPIVFLLWGRNAREKKKLVSSPRHYILEAAHPSPLSAYNGFFGCKHFSRANEILARNGKAPIDWSL